MCFVICQPSMCSPQMQTYAGAGRETMPVTSRGTASTPEEAPASASAPKEALATYCQTHPPSMHTGFSQPHTSAKRKAITHPSPHKRSMTSLTAKPKRNHQTAASENLEIAASSKRRKGSPADTQNCKGSPKENVIEMALDTGCIGPHQPLRQELKGLHVLQSPNRPPLVPRTPATADRTGRVPGMSSHSAFIAVSPTVPS